MEDGGGASATGAKIFHTSRQQGDELIAFGVQSGNTRSLLGHEEGLNHFSFYSREPLLFGG